MTKLYPTEKKCMADLVKVLQRYSIRQLQIGLPDLHINTIRRLRRGQIKRPKPETLRKIRMFLNPEDSGSG